MEELNPFLKIWKFREFVTNEEIRCNNISYENYITVFTYNKQIVAYGYLLTFIEYLTCKLKLIATIKSLTGKKINETMLCDTSIHSAGLAQKDLQLNYFTIYSDIFVLNIITSMVKVKDKSKFTFLKLFDLEIWLLLIVSIVLYNYFYEKFTKSRQSIWVTLINHPINKLAKQNKKNIYILMSIWLLMCLILSKSFSGILLNSYVNIRYEPAVGSLQDVINNPKLVVIGDYSTERNLNTTMSKEYEIIMKRIYKKLRSTEAFLSHKLMTKVNEGKAIIICSTINCPRAIALNPDKNFVYTKDRYFKNFLHYYIRRKHPFAKKIHKMLRICFETGIMTNYKERRILYFRGVRIVNIINMTKSYSTKYEIDDKNWNSITLVNLQNGIFLFAEIGLGISFLVFLSEMALDFCC